MSADGRSFEFDFHELVVDSFAGGGGASTGIRIALGRCPDVAVNHDGEALAMHEANHPLTRHIREDVWAIDPEGAMGHRQVGLLWASPDCKHFSKAKGGKPVSKKIRGLAWVVTKWADKVKPRVIIMENVEEFRSWGPLIQRAVMKIDVAGKPYTVKEWHPDPDRKGEYFERFLARFRKLGYAIEHRELRACDYGAPTIRKRLFLIARRDGLPIVWPAPTHGDPKKLPAQSGKVRPWRTAAECIDWSISCPSIFERKKPLAEATLRRIARGVMRYVVNSANPFIVPIANYGSGLRVNDADEPLTTITANPKGGAHAVVVPHITKFRNGATGAGIDEPLPTVTANSYIVRPGGSAPIGLVSAHVAPLTHHGDRRGTAMTDPMPTVTGAHRGEQAVIAATLIQAAHGEGKPGGVQRWGDGTADINQPVKTVTASNGQAVVAATIVKQNFGEKPCSDADEPLHTITTQGNRHSLVSATLVQTGYGEREGQAPRALDIGQPLGTVVGGGAKHAVIAALIERQFGNSAGNDADAPLGTVTAGGSGKAAVVAAFLAQHNTMPKGGIHAGHAATDPVSTISASGAQQQVVTSHLIKLRGTCQDGQPVDAPVPTVTASGTHAGEVRAFLVKYYGEGGQDQSAIEPMHTIPTKDRLGLVMVHGEPYEIVDIGMRMLTPRELATAQGFPADYIIDRKPDGTPLTKTAQVRMIGNSVCPPVAAALVRANFSHELQRPKLKAA